MQLPSNSYNLPMKDWIYRFLIFQWMDVIFSRSLEKGWVSRAFNLSTLCCLEYSCPARMECNFQLSVYSDTWVTMTIRHSWVVLLSYSLVMWAIASHGRYKSRKAKYCIIFYFDERDGNYYHFGMLIK